MAADETLVPMSKETASLSCTLNRNADASAEEKDGRSIPSKEISSSEDSDSDESSSESDSDKSSSEEDSSSSSDEELPEADSSKPRVHAPDEALPQRIDALKGLEELLGVELQVADDDDELNVEIEASRTRNEESSSKLKIPRPTLIINDSHKLVHVGAVTSVMENAVVIQSSPKDTKRNPFLAEDVEQATALDLGSIVCLENKELVGAVFDTCGPVTAPFYVVRFNNADEIQSVKGLAKDAMVFYIEQESKIVRAADVKGRGYDSSNVNDEEGSEVEFSDDDAESAAKRSEKRRHSGANVTNLRERGRSTRGRVRPSRETYRRGHFHGDAHAPHRVAQHGTQHHPLPGAFEGSGYGRPRSGTAHVSQGFHAPAGVRIPPEAFNHHAGMASGSPFAMNVAHPPPVPGLEPGEVEENPGTQNNTVERRIRDPRLRASMRHQQNNITTPGYQTMPHNQMVGMNMPNFPGMMPFAGIYPMNFGGMMMGGGMVPNASAGNQTSAGQDNNQTDGVHPQYGDAHAAVQAPDQHAQNGYGQAMWSPANATQQVMTANNFVPYQENVPMTGWESTIQSQVSDCSHTVQNSQGTRVNNVGGYQAVNTHASHHQGGWEANQDYGDMIQNSEGHDFASQRNNWDDTGADHFMRGRGRGWGRGRDRGRGRGHGGGDGRGDGWGNESRHSSGGRGHDGSRDMRRFGFGGH